MESKMEFNFGFRFLGEMYSFRLLFKKNASNLSFLQPMDIYSIIIIVRLSVGNRSATYERTRPCLFLQIFVSYCIILPQNCSQIPFEVKYLCVSIYKYVVTLMTSFTSKGCSIKKLLLSIKKWKKYSMKNCFAFLGK